MRIVLTVLALALAALAWHAGGELGERLGVEAFDPLPRLALLLAVLGGFDRVLMLRNGTDHADK